MKFKIIPNQQTPAVPSMPDSGLLIDLYADKLKAFLKFTSGRTNAIGLAANQVSLDGKRFRLNVFALKSLKTNKWQLIVNPNITGYVGNSEIKYEGCLTWKGQTIQAERFPEITVQYYDFDQRHHEDILSGLEAQIWQHEVNHLLGVNETIIDPAEFKTEPKKSIFIGRNEPCPCGSGKKYKKCCLTKTQKS